jgi:hypothetical protein
MRGATAIGQPLRSQSPFFRTLQRVLREPFVLKWLIQRATVEGERKSHCGMDQIGPDSFVDPDSIIYVRQVDCQSGSP